MAQDSVIDIGAVGPETTTVQTIKRKMETFCSSVCIYKVPDEFSIDCRSVFVPTQVSIGPFHHGSSHLKSMEEHKWLYLCAFLLRDSSLKTQLDDFVKLIENSEDRVKKCYAVEFHQLPKPEFTEMMLLDCCFILELLLRYYIKSRRRRNDPIFTTPGLLFDLRCDMILLENQVPYFLLKDIFEKANVPQRENVSLNELACRFFRTMIVGERQLIWDKFMQEGDHFLDMVHDCFLSTYPRVEPKESTKPKILLQASVLQKKGIRFKDARNPKSLLDIKFEDGVLEIPRLKVHGRSETIFSNLIAYEHCQVGSAQQVKSYVYFMGHLLDSNEDVKLLHQRKILTDNEDDEAQIIRNLNWMKQLRSSLSGAYFAGILQQIDNNSSSCVRRLRTLKTNPVVIGTAALLAVGVIFVAAFFSALAYLRHRYE